MEGVQGIADQDVEDLSTPVLDSYKPAGCTVLLETVSSGRVEKRDAIHQVTSINHMDLSSMLGVGGLTTPDLCSGMRNFIPQAGHRNLLQLMLQASNGELGPMDVGDCAMEYTSILEYPAEEEYYGGVESEEDTESSDDDGYTDDAVLPADNFIDNEKSTNEHISQFDDRISNKDFNSGRDYIYDSWELGIDDTDMNETEAEVDIGQELHLLSSLGEVGESSDQDQSCCYAANDLGTPDLLGGCGCQHVDLTQEISQKHREEIKLGFKKRAWAKGHYCAGMTSTQRSESANMMLKRFVPRNSSLNQFVSQYNVLLQDRDMEEGRQVDLTKQLVLKKTRMWPIERHACEIYTKASFMLFRKQVDRAASYVVSGKGDDFYVVSHNSSRERPKWAKVDFKVFVLNDGGRYFCECGFYEHIGILCCHAIRLMIRLDISKIPEEHIMTRWTRQAKDVLPEHLKGHQIEVSLNKPLVVHSMQLNAKALEAVSKGNRDIETLQVVMKHLNAAIKEVDGIIRAKREKTLASPEVQDKDNLCVDSEDALGTQTDVEAMQGNRYGASGSSAGMSDSEILKLKAPIANRARGRPRANRYRSQADLASKKLPTKKMISGESAEKRKACEDLGQSRAAKPKAKRQRKTKEDKTNSEENRGLPYQSRFCSKCKLAGHNRTTCGRQSKTANKKKTELHCTKCDLKGHIDADCLVVEDDSDSFFK